MAIADGLPGTAAAKRGSKRSVLVICLLGVLGLAPLTADSSLQWLDQRIDSPIVEAVDETAHALGDAADAAGFDVPFRLLRAAIRWAENATIS